MVEGGSSAAAEGTTRGSGGIGGRGRWFGNVLTTSAAENAIKRRRALISGKDGSPHWPSPLQKVGRTVSSATKRVLESPTLSAAAKRARRQMTRLSRLTRENIFAVNTEHPPDAGGAHADVPPPQPSEGVVGLGEEESEQQEELLDEAGAAAEAAEANSVERAQEWAQAAEEGSVRGEEAIAA
jgi:hypothetical protein